MKIKLSHSNSESAFTLAKSSVAVLIIGVAFAAIGGAFTSGFSRVQVTREDLRATQILVERMETIRLYRWDQIISSNCIPLSFTNYYSPDAVGPGGKGIPYTGSVKIASMPVEFPAAYSNNMRQVFVNIGWFSGKQPCQREIMSFVTRYGLQNHVYNPTNTPN